MEKTCKNFIEDTEIGVDLKIINYWNVKKVCSKESTSSIGSASLLELDDDASTCLSSENDRLNGISEPTTSQLPIKKGLSRYYQGKARTFTSLSDVKCIEDLAKKEISFVKRCHRTSSFQSPKAIISKKNTRGPATISLLNSLGHSRTL